MMGLLATATTHTAAVARDTAATWHESLVSGTVMLGIIVIMLGMLVCIYRLLRGPHLADRALAVDLVAIQLIGLVILLTMWFGSLVLFDSILVLSLLGFAGTVAMAQYIGRPHLKNPSSPTKDTAKG